MDEVLVHRGQLGHRYSCPIVAATAAASDGAMPARPMRKQAIGAAVRSDACAATPAMLSNVCDGFVVGWRDIEACREGCDPFVSGHAPILP